MSRPTPERLEEIRLATKAKGPNFVEQLFAEIDALRAEVEEQCRLNGMGAQRELKLITERDSLKFELALTKGQLADESGTLELVAGERNRLREA